MKKKLLKALKCFFLAALCALIIYLRGLTEFIVFFLAAVIHEGFHLICAFGLNVEISAPSAGLFGFKFTYDSRETDGLRGAAVFAAGSFGNIVLALTAAFLSKYIYIEKCSFFVFYNLVFAAVNLIPAYPMDAARIIYCLLSRRLGKLRTVKLICLISNFTAFLLFVSGLYVFIFKSDNLLLMLVALLIMNASSKELESARMNVLYDAERKYTPKLR